jgi:hypothetical protein
LSSANENTEKKASSLKYGAINKWTDTLQSLNKQISHRGL